MLLDEPSQDDGLWDLCALLTYLTGRNVTTEGDTERFRPDVYGDNAVDRIEVLAAAALAWENREHLLADGLHYALLTYNEALNTHVLQIAMSLYSTALNIFLDKQPVAIDLPTKQVRKDVKKRISDVLQDIPELNEAQRGRLMPLLGAAVDRGPSLADRLLAQIEACGLLSEPPTEEELARVKSVDRVRNRVVHAGRIPTFPGLDRPTSLRIATNLAAGVLPELVRLLIGERLGFTAESVGSLTQRREDLQTFFRRGAFRGWRLTGQTWDEFVEQLETEGWPEEDWSCTDCGNL